MNDSKGLQDIPESQEPEQEHQAGETDYGMEADYELDLSTVSPAPSNKAKHEYMALPIKLPREPDQPQLVLQEDGGVIQEEYGDQSKMHIREDAPYI